MEHIIRPHVRINVAATADGKIDTYERRGATISSAQDKERVDRLRAEADAVMIGGHTLHDEDPKLVIKSVKLQEERRRRGLPPNPAKVAISSCLQLRSDCAFLNTGPSRILLFTTSQTEPAQLDMLRSHGAEVHVLGGRQVDLAAVLRILKEAGVRQLMVEGGASLNFELIRLGLVDELTVYIAPLIFGGELAPTLADGAGFLQDAAVPLSLVECKTWEDGGVLLHYLIAKGK